LKNKNLKIFFSLSLIFAIFIAVYVIKNIFSKEENSALQEINIKGEDYFKENDFEKAISCWEKVLEANPQNLEIYQKIGVAYVRNNQIVEAIDIYEKGLKLDDKNSDLYYALAFSQFLRNDYFSSLKNLDKVLYFNEHYPEAHYLKGLIYEKKGLDNLAYKEFVAEINMNPSCVSAWRKIKDLADPQAGTPENLVSRE